MKDVAADAGGTTAIEYAIIASLIAMVIITGVSTIGTTLSGFFASITF